MNNNAPCPEWEKQLAALHPDDLTPNERAALEAHVATCLPCATTLAEYQRLTKLMREALIMLPPQQAKASSLITNMRNSSTSRGSFAARIDLTDQLSSVM